MSAVAIIGGTGPEGSGLALRWARAGQHVIIGSRDAARAHSTAEALRARVGPNANVEGMDNSAAVKAADTVVLSVPFEAQVSTLKQLKDSFRSGAVLICATVPLAVGVGDRATRTLGVWQGSAAEQAAEYLPEGVKIAGAFQNVSATVLDGDHDVDCDVIVCSDDPGAKQVACDLARKIPGVRAVDGGKLENSRIVEQITALLITLNIRNSVKHAGIRITGLPK